MLPLSRGVVATFAALLLSSPVLAQSKDDIAAKIESALPSTGRGQITGANLRDVLKTFNGARGQPGGIAELGTDGKLPGERMPSVFSTDNATLGGEPLTSVLSKKAPIDTNGNISARGLNAVSDGSNSIPIDAFWAGVNPNLIRYANQAKLTSKLDGEAWESALGVDCQFVTGYGRPYQSGLTVAVGDNVYSGAGVPESYSYRVVQAGTLGATPPTAGPGSAAFTSGTARLQWINYTNLAAKLCFTTTTFMSGNAGTSWGANFNFHMRPLNNQPKFVSGIEQDFYNDSGWDCLLFSGNTCNAYNMYLSGSNRSTVGLNIGKLTANSVFATEWAVAIQGQYLASDAIIQINTTNSKVGIGVGRYHLVFGRSTYSESAYRDESQAPNAISLGGIYSDAAIKTIGMDSTTALRMANYQRVCWGDNNGGCVYYDPPAGFVWTSGGGSKFIIGSTGNLNAIGSITGSSFIVGNQVGVSCSGPPTNGFKVSFGIVTAC